MTIIEGLDWVVEKLLPYFFAKFDSWMIADGVSVLGFSVGITILVIVVGAIILRV